MSLIRLNKYIAEQGICSRRQADELIKDGKVKINGKVIKELGFRINNEKDKVELKNKILNQVQNNTQNIYIALNKPVGYISSTTSKQGKSIMELIPKKFGRLYPVGRLDKNSCGLMILTNDGELTNILTHPKFGHEKEYLVDLNRQLKRGDIKTLKTSLKIEGVVMKMKNIEQIENNQYKIILTEGKKRPVSYTHLTLPTN